MSNVEVTALVVTGAWLGVLTFVVVLIIRQVGLLTARLDHGNQLTASVEDGAEIGSTVPPAIANILPTLATSKGAYLILLSAHCSPCRELAASLPRDLAARGYEIIALVPGRKELADGIAAMLPRGVRVVPDPEATSIAREFDIRSVPFVLEVKGGVITGRIHPPRVSAADIDSLMDEHRALSESRSLPHASREVISHAI